MTEFFSNSISSIFGDNVILGTILLSIIPLIELRGAIPFATSPALWGELALSPWNALLWALLGSTLVVPLLAAVFLPIIRWLKSTKAFAKLANWIEKYFLTKGKNVTSVDSTNAAKKYWKKMLLIFLFVAVPLPLTGVYTGTCIALLSGMDYLSTCIAVMTGNVIAGLCITLILIFIPWLNNYLFFIFLGLIIVMLIVELSRALIIRRKTKDEGEIK